MKNSGLLLALATLLPLSASAAGPLTWTYTDCVNFDGVTATSDKSEITITNEGDASRFKWETKLFAGYDEMSKKREHKPSVMVSDPNPVSASWDLTMGSPTTVENDGKTTSITWKMTGNPAIGNATKSSDTTSGTVAYTEERSLASGSETRASIQLTQSFKDRNGNAEVWVSKYSATGMSRTVTTTDADGSVTDRVGRECGASK